MNSNEFKEKLLTVTPDVPEHFHNRVEMTLENIVAQEAQMKESTKQAIKTAGRFSGRTLAIAIALVLHAWKRNRDREAARRSLRGPAEGTGEAA